MRSAVLYIQRKCASTGAEVWVAITGSDLYTTHHPCVLCIKLMIDIGIWCVVNTHSYPDQLVVTRKAGYELVQFQLRGVRT